MNGILMIGHKVNGFFLNKNLPTSGNIAKQSSQPMKLTQEGVNEMNLSSHIAP